MAAKGNALRVPAAGRSSVFALNVKFKHDNSTSVKEFMQTSAAALGKKDFSRPLSILEKHWVKTVGDLRLLVQEGLLRSIGLPLRLCVWIEKEVSSVDADSNSGLVESFSEMKIAAGGFVHQFDFDTNGMLYFIGTAGLTKPWKNPAKSGLVRVSCSGVMKDSVPMDALVGRDTVRCVTTAVPGSWVQVDLVSKWAVVSHYTLKHYASWDTEALRSWNFEASNDGKTWTLLKEHLNDTSLDKRGGTHTWELENVPKIGFRMFRLRLTGVNSNKHFHLACSGIEFYGTMSDEPPPTFRQASRRGSTVQVFIPRQPFDDSGIIYHIGSTLGGGSGFVNPMDYGVVKCSASGLMANSEHIKMLVDRKVVRLVTNAEANSWMVVDFTDHKVCPTHYALRHYSSWDTECIRSWQFQGSNDGVKFTTLSVHVNDETINGKGGVGMFNVPPRFHNKPFRMFRILMTDKNSNGHMYLALSGFEIYGQLVGPKLSRAVMNAAKEFNYKSDLDECGIVHWIATKGLTQPWQNPADAGLLDVTASSLMNDSEPASAVVGHKVVRCVTKPHTNSFFVIDFKTKWIQPTAYTLRHYSSWDVEALRNWNFEASNDGANWVLLAKHKDDDSLAAKGATHTWTVPKPPLGYRMFRILQWGVNSNQHNYLALSGFEIYGTLSSSPPSVVNAASVPQNQLVWDPLRKSKFLQIDPTGLRVTNTGSSDKWQMARTVHSVGSGHYRYHLRIVADKPTTNTWKFIVGVIPTSFPLKGKEWVGAVNSWGYIAGTGGKCHSVAKTYPHGASYGAGDVVTVDLNFEQGLITFEKNGVAQGKQPAFDNLNTPVHLAVSFTGTGSTVMIVQDEDVPKPLSSGVPTWDPNRKSRFLEVDEKSGVVTNMGSRDKWQSVRGVVAFESGKHSFEIEVASSPATPNNWRFIVGVVPNNFPLTWVGAAKSWGYIAGTGGKCYNIGSSTPYGQAWGKPGDRVRVTVDLDAMTLSFALNGVDQGVAFKNVKGPVYPAVSLTATGAQVRYLVE